MKPTRKLSRRSFLGRVAGGAIAGGAALTVLGTPAEAQVSDSDSGRNADPAGRGRTGVTDGDSGSNADRAGHGRGGRRPAGRTDSDPTDRPGQGGGVTDRDTGRYADPPGRGRGRRNCSDSDSGRYGDPGGRGRRC